MSPDDFLDQLASILEVDRSKIELDSKLEDLEIWDSINVLSYMMLVDENFQKQVDPEAVKNCTTIGGLYDLAIA